MNSLEDKKMNIHRLPELNNVLIVGNLTRDPVFRRTTNNIPVVNFILATNRRYRDSLNQRQEDVCYVGVVAWSKLAESCYDWLKKGNAVLVDGELQSRNWQTEDGFNRTTVEIKAKNIQFLNRTVKPIDFEDEAITENEEEDMVIKDSILGKFLSGEE